MKILGIIPARYASTRFPGKPLAMIGSKPMIQWVWEGVGNIPELDHVVVATDDDRIFNAVKQFGGNVVMTSSSHRSGTDRCGEVLQQMGTEALQYDVVINIQGDEPKVAASQIATLAHCFDNPGVQIATLKKRITDSNSLFSPNCVKVTTTLQGNAVTFSRHPVPYLRGMEQSQWLDHYAYYKHIGIYAFRREVLQQVVTFPPTPIEQAESLEQMRWIENGLTIAVCETDVENIAIDTPADLEHLLASLPSNSNNID